jgi:transposase
MGIVARSRGEVVHLGLDVHRDTISVGVLTWDREEPALDKIPSDAESVRRLIDRFPDRTALRVCYEAGPTGYDLARLLRRWGVSCDVIAPSLIPKAAGDKVKTDKRDARRLARLHRAGELTAIHIPTLEQEAVRDLCRARADVVIERTRARHRLSKFLLRHSEVFRQGAQWTQAHEQWLRRLHFDDRALQLTFQHYQHTLACCDGQLHAIDADLAGYFDAGPFANQVRRLACYRGVTELGGLTLASEVVDWRRFPTAASFMCFTGLVPSEDSSGRREHRGKITRAGNVHVRTQLVESAWAYQYRPAVGAVLARRQHGAPAATITRSWTAQQRLTTRFRRMQAQRHHNNVVATAIARELSGFLWAEMTH